MQNEDRLEAVFSLPGVFRFPISTQSRSEFKSWAAFGDVSYDLTSRFTLGTGLRYFEEDQESVSGPSVQAKTFDSVNPRFYAQYKMTEQANVYLSAAKGFRTGGFNLPALPTYGPESVWTYELGTKASLSGGRVTAEVAVFHSDYRDHQIVGLVQVGGVPFDVISNAGDATIKGVEGAFAWYPSDQWTLSINGNYLDTEFAEIDATFSSHAVGDPLDFVPKYGYTVSAQHDFTWNGRSGFARIDYNENGRSTLMNRYVNGALGGPTPWYRSESDVINLLNLNVGLQWSAGFSVGVFAQNLLNDRGLTDAFDIQAAAARARPLTYGVQVGVRFE
jgi:outer membrane receptor protein involved in Fe transport